MKDLDDRQAAMHEAISAARELLEHLECAESCETLEDFNANLAEARSVLKNLKGELEELTDT